MTNYLNQFMSPDSSQMFAWYCIYGDEENSEDKQELYGPFSLVEIQNDGKEHEFSEIEKEKLSEFGLVGNGSRIYFNTKTGVFNIGEKYLSVIRKAAENYTKEIFHKLREREYNPELMRLHVVGGGGCMIQNLGDYDNNRVIIVRDICATAKGYEAMTVRKIQKNGGMLV